MVFTSYAQNFEDVMLWKALKHIDKGRYIDIGAQHPVIDSVSKAFYDLGWRGIHIEPVPHYAELLRQHRPDETVLEAAISDTDGRTELHVIENTGLSTAIEAYAVRHQQERMFECRTISVPTLMLKSAIPLTGGPVHWLKIDVEGLEEQALLGWDSGKLRPWIMVVEATLPGSPVSGHERWECLLTGAGYRFAYFDGLNRFYVANEHEELADAFCVPPNVFDEIRLTENSSLCNMVTAASRQQILDISARYEHCLADNVNRIEQLKANMVSVEQRLEKMANSRLWRINDKLRHLNRKIKRLVSPSIRSSIVPRQKQTIELEQNMRIVHICDTLSPNAAKIFENLIRLAGNNISDKQEQHR